MKWQSGGLSPAVHLQSPHQLVHVQGAQGQNRKGPGDGQCRDGRETRAGQGPAALLASLLASSQ